jgi:hypothetical protein
MNPDTAKTGPETRTGVRHHGHLAVMNAGF